MCVNCLSNAEFAAINVMVVGGAVSNGVRTLAGGRSRDERRLVRDVRTVAFLRDLSLDPGEVLGADVVAAVDRARIAPRTMRSKRSATSLTRDLYTLVRCAAGAMRSQSLVSPQ